MSKRDTSLKAYSFTEPVVRKLRDKAKATSQPNRIFGSSAETVPKAEIAVFHKTREKRKNADITGSRHLKIWKQSSGRGKSWKTCRRLKLTQDSLELFTDRKGHPVTFGWPLSVLSAPTPFVRGHGLYVNKQGKSKKTRLPLSRDIEKQLHEESDSDSSLQDDFHHIYCTKNKGVYKYGRLEKLADTFLRLNITHRAIDISVVQSLKGYKLETRQCKQPRCRPDGETIIIHNFVVLDLIHNYALDDVYQVSDSKKPSSSYHAHVFLKRKLFQSKNNSKEKISQYAWKKMARLRNSHSFCTEYVQSDKTIIMMRGEDKGILEPHVKNMQQEFPSLPGTSKCIQHVFSSLDSLENTMADVHIGVKRPKSLRPKKEKLSYAAALKNPPPESVPEQTKRSNHNAYKAWQERCGIQRPNKALSMVLPSGSEASSTPTLQIADEVRTSVARESASEPLCKGLLADMSRTASKVAKPIESAENVDANLQAWKKKKSAKGVASSNQSEILAESDNLEDLQQRRFSTAKTLPPLPRRWTRRSIIPDEHHKTWPERDKFNGLLQKFAERTSPERGTHTEVDLNAKIEKKAVSETTSSNGCQVLAEADVTQGLQPRPCSITQASSARPQRWTPRYVVLPDRHS